MFNVIRTRIFSLSLSLFLHLFLLCLSGFILRQAIPKQIILILTNLAIPKESNGLLPTFIKNPRANSEHQPGSEPSTVARGMEVTDRLGLKPSTN